MAKRSYRAAKSAARQLPKEFSSFDLVDLATQAVAVEEDTPEWLIDTPEKATRVLYQLRNVTTAAFDTETTGLKPADQDYTEDISDLDYVPGQDHMVGFSIAFRLGGSAYGYYIPTRHYHARCLPTESFMPLLEQIVGLSRIYIHNAAFDLKVMATVLGRPVWDRNNVYDTLSAMHTLIQGEEEGAERNVLGLKKLALRIFNRPMRDFDEQWRGPAILRAPMDELSTYAKDDAEVTLLLGEWLEKETAVQGTRPYIESTGIKMIPILAAINYEGVRVDRNKLSEMLEWAYTDRETLIHNLQAVGGRTLNPNSRQQMEHIIYDVLGMPQISDRTASGARSLAGDTLRVSCATAREMGVSGESIKLVEDFISLQGLEKIRGSFLEPLLAWSVKDEMIHPELLQTGTVSGRLASRNPNMQNLVSDRKAKILGRFYDIRGCLLPDKGHLFINEDESNLELRILSHFCGDPTLVSAFHKKKEEGGDVHKATAMMVFDYTEETWNELPKEESSKKRSHAKTVSFGLIYGMGVSKLAATLGITIPEAQKLLQTYFERMPNVVEWCTTMEQEILRNGEIQTLSGRIRRTTLHRSRDERVRASAVRSVRNSKIQGSAADVMNSAMTRIYNDPAFKESGARFILQIHDELLITCPEAKCQQIYDLVEFYLNNPIPGLYLKVPLVAEGKISDRWEH